MSKQQSFDYYLSKETKAFLVKHRCLSNEINSEVEKWQKSSLSEARRASTIHFAEESALIEDIKSSDTNVALSSLGVTRGHYESLSSVVET